MKQDSIYNVQFSTMIRPYFIDVPVRANSEEHAKRIARRICKFGVIAHVTVCEAASGYCEAHLVTEENSKHFTLVEN